MQDARKRAEGQVDPYSRSDFAADRVLASNPKGVADFAPERVEKA